MRRVRVEVRLADLVVLQDAVGVAEAAAPPARHALGQLDDGGVVAVHAFAHLEHADVPELRERTQQLSARRRGIVPQRRACERRIAEERVRHRLGQRGRSEGQILRIELVDVDRGVDRPAERQMIAARADVTDVDRHVGAQLALEIDGVLLHARRLASLIDEVDVRARARQQTEAVAGRPHQAVRERIGHRHRRRHRRLRRRRVVREADGPVRRGARRRVVPRRPVHAVSAAEHGLGIERIDGAEARRELRRRRIALLRRVAVDAGKLQPAADLAGRRAAGWIDVPGIVMLTGLADVRSNPTVKLLFASRMPSSCSMRRP